MLILKTFLGLLVCLSLFVSSVPAETLPEGWPWRGVNMDNLAENKPEDLQRIVANLPINSVRLQIKPAKQAKLNKVALSKTWQDSLVWLDTMLDQCAESKLSCVISFDDFPFAGKDLNYKTTSAFWNDQQAKDHVVEWVGQLARRYAKRGSELGGYDILSEPVLRKQGRSLRPPGWEVLQGRIIQEIRKYDKDVWIVVKPGPWGSPRGYRDFLPLEIDARLIYSVHMYLPHEFTHQGVKGRKLGLEYPGVINGQLWNADRLKTALRPLRYFEQRFHVPVWVGEFSAVRWAKGGELYVETLAEIFDEYNWGWGYFSFSLWHGWNPDYDSQFFKRGEDWERHKVGTKSARWQALFHIFKVPKSDPQVEVN